MRQATRIETFKSIPHPKSHVGRSAMEASETDDGIEIVQVGVTFSVKGRGYIVPWANLAVVHVAAEEKKGAKKGGAAES